MYIHTYIIHICIGTSSMAPARTGGSSGRPPPDVDYICREFRDVVFEEVVFDNDSRVCDPVIYCCLLKHLCQSMIIKHILKHHILELPNVCQYCHRNHS